MCWASPKRQLVSKEASRLNADFADDMLMHLSSVLAELMQSPRLVATLLARGAGSSPQLVIEGIAKPACAGHH
jgi:hypothetical protein